ncbi:MAG: HugZ family protein [Endozoicomonas sp.]|uniref:HugZ family pyridoxamine 5'-phosphate oxidase n=1 Tax=Endozoicomonas sp. TaxID=1892382 RepID=UPI003D9B0361
MEPKVQAAHDARNLLLNEYHGILSTHSDDVPGYPFGSVMPYCLDKHGNPVILISDLAQHTKNVEANPKVSLIITQSGVDDIHKAGRLTWIGDAEKIEADSEEVKELEQRYYAFFPPSANYHKTHGFDFYRIHLKRARFIGGFGKIFWVKNELMTRENPFYGSVENGMVKHMNEDHVDAMVKYCKAAGIEIPEGVEPKMAGIDATGMHLLLNDKLVRIPFPTEVEEPMAVRKTLVEMAKVA